MCEKKQKSECVPAHTQPTTQLTKDTYIIYLQYSSFKSCLFTDRIFKAHSIRSSTVRLLFLYGFPGGFAIIHSCTYIDQLRSRCCELVLAVYVRVQYTLSSVYRNSVLFRSARLAAISVQVVCGLEAVWHRFQALSRLRRHIDRVALGSLTSS